MATKQCKPKGSGVQQLADELDPEAVAHEYAAACKDYCATLTSLTEQVRRGEELSLDQMDQLEAAKLRLENAWTLCELYVGGLDTAGIRPSPSPSTYH
jgi:hypothetical protein